MERRIRKRDKNKKRVRDREGFVRDDILRCPFCLVPIAGHVEIKTPYGGEIDGGKCNCGTVYVCDRSGRMLGEAFTDAVAMAYDWDFDAAFEHGEESYEEFVIRFDKRVNKFMAGDGGPLDRSPKYYFIKRKDKSGDKEE
jgi:hypothetical protein